MLTCIRSAGRSSRGPDCSRADKLLHTNNYVRRYSPKTSAQAYDKSQAQLATEEERTHFISRLQKACDNYNRSSTNTCT